jgi:hypothetical protein
MPKPAKAEAMEILPHTWKDLQELALTDTLAESIVTGVEEGLATRVEALIAGFIVSRAENERLKEERMRLKSTRVPGGWIR